MRALTARQQAFVEHFIRNGGDAKAAVIAAGYKPASADMAVYKMRRRPHVIEAIRRTEQEIVRLLLHRLRRREELDRFQLSLLMRSHFTPAEQRVEIAGHFLHASGPAPF